MQRFEEAKALLRGTVPAARRVRGENDETTLSMRWMLGGAFCKDPAATLEDVRRRVGLGPLHRVDEVAPQ